MTMPLLRTESDRGFVNVIDGIVHGSGAKGYLPPRGGTRADLSSCKIHANQSNGGPLFSFWKFEPGCRTPGPFVFLNDQDR